MLWTAITVQKWHVNKFVPFQEGEVYAIAHLLDAVYIGQAGWRVNVRLPRHKKPPGWDIWHAHDCRCASTYWKAQEYLFDSVKDTTVHLMYALKYYVDFTEIVLLRAIFNFNEKMSTQRCAVRIPDNISSWKRVNWWGGNVTASWNVSWRFAALGMNMKL